MAYKKADSAEAAAGKDEVRSGPPILKLESGKLDKFKKTWLRILPPRDDHPNNKYYLWIKAHFNVGPNERAVFCSAMSDNECAVCAECARLRREGFTKEAEEMAAKVYGLLNVVEVDDNSNAVGDIMVWRAPKGVLVDLLNKIDDLDAGERDVSDPETGRDVYINKKGEKLKTRYEVGYADDPTVFNDGEFDILDEGLHDLTMVFPELSLDRVQAILQGGTSGPRRDPFADEEEDVVEGEVTEVEETPPARRLPAARREAPPSASNGRGHGSTAPTPRGRGSATSRRSSEDEVKARLRAAITTEEKDDDEDDD